MATTSKRNVASAGSSGYLSYDNRYDLLLEVVSGRYEHKPVLLTTNMAFRWYYANGTDSSPRLARIRLRRWLHSAKGRPRS